METLGRFIAAVMDGVGGELPAMVELWARRLKDTRTALIASTMPGETA